MSRAVTKIKMPARGEPYKKPLMERFARTVPEFQCKLREIAAAGGKTIEYVYGLWEDYCANGTDQSKIVSEFKQWYAKQLAPAKAQHTPGPWQHIPRVRDGHVDTIAHKGSTFVQVGVPYREEPILDYPHENVQTANARLIAAAPELLAACHLALGSLDALGADNGTIRCLREAIAKAEGGAA